MSSWPVTLPGRGVARRRPAGAILRAPPGRARVILEDDRAIVRADDDRACARGYSAPVRALTSLRARVRALPPGRADLLLAGAFLLETQVELSCLDASAGTVLAVARRCSSSWRSAWPRAAARRSSPPRSVFAALTVHGAARRLGEYVAWSGPSSSAFIVSYSLGANLEGRGAGRRAWRWLVALVTAMAHRSTRRSDDAAQPRLGLARDRRRADARRPAAAQPRAPEPRAARRRPSARARARERAAERGGGRGAHADRRRAARRRRARASAMIVQAGGARRLRRARPGTRARGAFAAVEKTGREALTELRRLLGVLRREDEELALAPQPSLAPRRSLVRARRARPACRSSCASRARRAPLPAGVDLTAYRVVQEALGGARERGRAARATRARALRGRRRRARGRRRRRPRGRRAARHRASASPLYGGELRAGAAPRRRPRRARPAAAREARREAPGAASTRGRSTGRSRSRGRRGLRRRSATCSGLASAAGVAAAAGIAGAARVAAATCAARARSTALRCWSVGDRARPRG